MIGVFQSPRERAHSAAAWAALVCDEPARVTCPVCLGAGATGRFNGHGCPEVPVECRMCWGAGEIREGEL